MFTFFKILHSSHVCKLLTSSAREATYLGVDGHEQEVGVQPDAHDGDLPVEAGAQLVTQVGPDQRHAPGTIIKVDWDRQQNPFWHKNFE